jgi:hypothetical protein
MPGTLFVVATPIGNLEDVTVRALRILREVSVIAAEDTRRTAHLLARHAIATPMTSLHEHNEAGKSVSLSRDSPRRRVALVSDAGTQRFRIRAGAIRAAIDAGIRVNRSRRAPSWRLLAASGSRPTPFRSSDSRRRGQKTENRGSPGSKASQERSFSSKHPTVFARRSRSCSAPSGIVQLQLGVK